MSWKSWQSDARTKGDTDEKISNILIKKQQQPKTQKTNKFVKSYNLEIFVSE